MWSLLEYFWIFSRIIILRGDEMNPGPTSSLNFWFVIRI